MTSRSGRVVSVNVGRVRTTRWQGRDVDSAIWKEPVAGRVALRGINAVGDDQADRRVHGGTTKALYAYAAEDYRWWADRLGRALAPGTFGENLTVEGLDLIGALIGERWRVGSAVVRVTEPRIPCFKLAMRLDDPGFKDAFTAAGRPGTYLAIEVEGDVGAGDEVTPLERPAATLTVGDVARARAGDDDLLPRLVASTELSDEWRDWARRRLRPGTDAAEA